MAGSSVDLMFPASNITKRLLPGKAQSAADQPGLLRKLVDRNRPLGSWFVVPTSLEVVTMEREHLESAAASYSYLRGFLSIPAGAAFVLAGLANLEWGPLRHIWVFWVSVLVMGVAYLRIVRYYNENYGRITPSSSTHARRATAALIGALVTSFGGVQLDFSFALPVSATTIALALVMLVHYAIGVGLRTHQMIICGSLLVTGLLPIWSGVGPDGRVNAGLVLAGAAIMMLGIFDHGALKHTFGSTDGLNTGNGNAGA
jgi:hypothetical protein